MARPPALSGDEKTAVSKRILKWAADTPRLSWRARADLIKEKTGRSITDQSLINASAGTIGRDNLDIIEKFFDESLQQWLAESLGLARPEQPAIPERFVERTERYHNVAKAFARARAAGVDEKILDTVRLDIGVMKSTTGPTLEEVEQAIREEIAQTRRATKLYSADDIDEGLNEPSKPRPKRR